MKKPKISKQPATESCFFYKRFYMFCQHGYLKKLCIKKQNAGLRPALELINRDNDVFLDFDRL